MDKLKSNLDFRLMSTQYKFRDLLLPRIEILKEVGIEPGFSVLDYGCGPGSYVTPIAELVGESGKIYALDIHPLAIRMVQGIALRKKLKNVETILSNCETRLPDNSIDIVLLYDIFHGLSEPKKILKELHRVLKSNGILSFNDHHMKDNEVKAKLIDGGFFKLSRKGGRIYTFIKVS